MMIMGLFFMMSIQPIIMVVVLIMITLLYSLFVYKIMGSFWFSYALVLVMLSGILVVFMYMVSLLPNESFEIYNLIFIVVFMLFLMKINFSVYGMDFSLISFNLWHSYIGLFNLFLVSFLLSIMVMVIWISCLGEGAVRVE